MPKKLHGVLTASAMLGGTFVLGLASTASAAPAPQSSCVAQTVAFEGPPGPLSVPAGYFGLDGIAQSHICSGS